MKILGLFIILIGTYTLGSSLYFFIPYDLILGSLFSGMGLIIIWSGFIMRKVQ